MDPAQFESLIETIQDKTLQKQQNGWERHLTTILSALVTAGIVYLVASVQDLRSEVKLMKFQFSTFIEANQKQESSHVVRWEFNALSNRVEVLEREHQEIYDQLEVWENGD